MACPYFFPTERLDAALWPHRDHLPLGDGWRGRCTAAGRLPHEQQLRDFCNLGYAKACPYLPAGRKADSVRLGARAVNGRIVVSYVYEHAHAPGESGTLEFDVSAGSWLAPHPDPCLQRMAECFLASVRRKIV